MNIVSAMRWLWNVNKQRPSAESIRNWLDLEIVNDAQIVTFAMQEVPHAEILKATPTHNTWSEQLTFYMKAHNYSLINKLCLASNMLLVYFRCELLEFIDRIDDRWCRNNLFGTLGYKGTISTRIHLRCGINLIFITSHFFAEERMNQERITQYKKSLYCTFPEDKSRRKLIVWQGDMNFRLEGFANSAQLIALFNRLKNPNEFAQVAEAYDQLIKAKRSGLIFSDFEEATIGFQPTYRILIGSGSFDPLRIPSWCDRILYTANNMLTIQRYSSHRNITLSDHFPVLAEFKFHIDDELLTSYTGWPCKFTHIPEWEELIPLVCRLLIPETFWEEHGSNFDWIGIYPASLEMIQRPILWLYVFTCPFDEQRRLIAEFQPLEAGTYRIGYFCSQKNFIQAISNTFNVKKILERR